MTNDNSQRSTSELVAALMASGTPYRYRTSTDGGVQDQIRLNYPTATPRVDLQSIAAPSRTPQSPPLSIMRLIRNSYMSPSYLKALQMFDDES